VTPLPRIADLTRAGEALRMTLELTPELSAFDGHFPGTPILPAVAQVDWAVSLAQDHYQLPAHFNSLRSLKFLRIVQPPVTLTLELTRANDGRSVAFIYSQGGSACSSGRIEFADDAAGPDRSFL
jgi:3-hydroxymyristoyl/3-hydroxydecanoyl-(acyl carrier protein) dehydratase